MGWWDDSQVYWQNRRYSKPSGRWRWSAESKVVVGSIWRRRFRWGRIPLPGSSAGTRTFYIRFYKFVKLSNHKIIENIIYTSDGLMTDWSVRFWRESFRFWGQSVRFFDASPSDFTFVRTSTLKWVHKNHFFRRNIFAFRIPTNNPIVGSELVICLAIC